MIDLEHINYDMVYLICAIKVRFCKNSLKQISQT